MVGVHEAQVAGDGKRLMKPGVLLLAASLLILPGAPRRAHADPPPASAWRMTFSDEFNRDVPDPDKWVRRAGATSRGLDRRPANVELQRGVCRLLTRKEKQPANKWTIAHLSTKHFRQKYGYFEARIKIAGAAGFCGIFWFATDYGKAGIDHFFLDIARIYPPRKCVTRLGNLNRGGWHVATEQWSAPSDLSEDFHLYAIEWNDKELIWYFDGREFRRSPHTRCRHEVAVHFITAVGGVSGEAAKALDGASMDVDYLRVYEKLDRPPAWSEWHNGVQ